LKIFQNEKRKVTTGSIIDYSDATTTKGSKELDEIFGLEDLRNEMRPKPVELLIKLLQIGSNENDMIMDFFSGTITIAEAVFKINNEKLENRKILMVQLPEAIDERFEAFKLGYKTIAEIGKERIRRRGNKIKSESNNKNPDIGFKVFKLDSSNLKKWDPDYNNPDQSVLTSVDNIK
jgi:adenine-specific DNA-methyltransferase